MLPVYWQDANDQRKLLPYLARIWPVVSDKLAVWFFDSEGKRMYLIIWTPLVLANM